MTYPIIKTRVWRPSHYGTCGLGTRFGVVIGFVGLLLLVTTNGYLVVMRKKKKKKEKKNDCLNCRKFQISDVSLYIYYVKCVGCHNRPLFYDIFLII
jgi:hypothetical protein